MEESNKNIGHGYTPATHFIGDCYQPIPPQGALPKSLTPPKGGTGARTFDLKTVRTAIDKAQGK